MRVFIVEQEFQYDPGRIVAVYNNEAEAVARSLNEANRVAEGDDSKVIWNEQRNSHEVRLRSDAGDDGIDCGFRVLSFPVL